MKRSFEIRGGVIAGSGLAVLAATWVVVAVVSAFSAFPTAGAATDTSSSPPVTPTFAAPSGGLLTPSSRRPAPTVAPTLERAEAESDGCRGADAIAALVRADRIGEARALARVYLEANAGDARAAEIAALTGIHVVRTR